MYPALSEPYNLYTSRGVTFPIQLEDGSIIRTAKGAPNIILQLIDDKDLHRQAEEKVKNVLRVNMTCSISDNFGFPWTQYCKSIV